MAKHLGDPEAASVAERARGLVLVERGAGAGAARVLQGAVRLAEAAGRPERAAQARGSLAWVLALCGRGPDALRELELARPQLRGLDRARMEMQLGMVLQKLDRHAEALEHYRRALSGFRDHGDRLWEARLLCNRGILHAERGALTAARADLARSEVLERADGRTLGAAHMAQNLGWLSAVQGDAPAAFAAYDRADEEIRAAGGTLAVLRLDRIALLLSVALHDEARETAERTIHELRQGGMRAYRAEARLALSGIALQQGDTATALAEARRARTAFQEQDRPRWALLAELAGVRAEHARRHRTHAALARTQTVADALEEAGWRTLALEARVLHAELALALGGAGAARVSLARAARARDRAGPAGRMAAWHAEALLRAEEGRRSAAESAVRAGLRVLDRHRAVLGATELRARAGAHGAALAQLGVRLALERRDPQAVLAAAERHRAQALRFPPVRPPVDPVLAGLLAELRQAAARMDAELLACGAPRPAAAQLARLERAIVDHARHAPAWNAPPSPSPARLRPALGERALVELLHSGGALYAVTIARGRARLHPLGTLADAERQLETMRFALRRLVSGHGTERSRAAVRALGVAAGEALGAQLAPALAATGDAPLVIVPTRSLHALPWAALPALHGRPLSVAPSAALWLRAAQERRVVGSVLAVAGPGLAEADAEAAAVAGAVGDATVLSGRAATAGATLAALDGCGHAHVAAHGTFRADNPLFSSLRLADGPLTVFDLETLAHPPQRIVLFACDAGISAVHPGDELMGLTAALLGLGTATVIASVLPLPDTAGAALAPRLAARLSAGEPADAVLAALCANEPGAAGLVCFGAA